MRTATAFLVAATTVKGLDKAAAEAAMASLGEEKLIGLPSKRKEWNGRAEEAVTLWRREKDGEAKMN